MATIYDVAKLAKVSTATVSNAFNRPEQMKPETRERIMFAAQSLGYSPNINAQALARGRSTIVGLLVSDIRMPLAANVSRGVEDKLTEAGYMPMIVSTDGDASRTISLIDKLVAHGACGFIITPAEFGIPDEVRSRLMTLHTKNLAVVVAGYDLDTSRLNYVAIRGQVSAKDLTRHFIDLGHRDIAYLGNYFSRGLAVRRWLGFQEAMLGCHIHVRPDLVIQTKPTPVASYNATAQLMSLPTPPTAILAMNDIYARGVIDYVTKHSIEVPTQLSIGTYDYQALAQRTTPRMTSISISSYQLGWQSAEFFLNILADPQAKPRREIIEYKLEIRETTAPPSQ